MDSVVNKVAGLCSRHAIKGDVLLTGHTHIPACEDRGGWWYLNPGSVSIPKNGSWHGYMIFEEGNFLWKDLDGNVRLEWKMNKE